MKQAESERDGQSPEFSVPGVVCEVKEREEVTFAEEKG